MSIDDTRKSINFCVSCCLFVLRVFGVFLLCVFRCLAWFLLFFCLHCLAWFFWCGVLVMFSVVFMVVLREVFVVVWFVGLGFVVASSLCKRDLDVTCCEEATAKGSKCE